MPHIPGHNRPFTSFLTQGMQNTNQNINNLNIPGGQTNYLNPPNIYSPISQSFKGKGMFGGNGLFDDPNFTGEGMPSGEGGQIPPGMGVGGWYTPCGKNPDYVPGGNTGEEGEETPPIIGGEGIHFAEGMQKGIPGSVIDESVPDTEMPTEELPLGWTWQWVNGNWEPVNVGAGEGQQGEQDFIGTGTGLAIDPDMLGGGTGGTGMAGEHPGYNVGTDYQGGNYLETGESKMGLSWDVNNDNTIDIADYQLAQSQGAEQGFLDNLLNQIQGGIGQASNQFAGGGGVARSAAKRLYYPSTKGGFASVGKGLSQSNTLEDILSKMQGSM